MMQKSCFFDNSSNVAIANSHLSISVNQSMDPSAALRFLYEAMAKYAGSGHQDPSTCLEGTRTTALEEIHEWKRKSRQDQGSKLMWLTGSAGSGKTAIAQTVCERCRKEGLFVVDCSFFRSTNRTNPKYLFLTIAYQLAVANALLRASIEAAAQTNPAVVDAALDVQLKRLILDPITKAGSQLPTVFVILDGLDECNAEPQQIQIIHLIQTVIQDEAFPIRFLIASRPEIWIRNAFSSAFLPPMSTVTLNRDVETNDDIRFFYETEFSKIREHPEHNHLFVSTPTPWPSAAKLDELVDRASSQFICAKTVVRFVGELGHSPIRRLDVVLHPLSESPKSRSPLDQLDALYYYTLSCVADWDLTSVVLGTLSVFKGDHMQREVLSVIEVIHGLNPGSAYLALRHLHPLVSVPFDITSERDRCTNEEYRVMLNGQSQYPRFYHKSFIDFLHNSRRAGKIFIDEEMYWIRKV
ncbi:hypothetical protein CPB83DRAFT_895958 [Crepidotus variabilis]|uniref:Nephrocystin 3-like N-terminal domain-containing protein n=1 Tax=Crepidotus variabilis TaxID=179855 RepID=A0A9P6EBX8_9AGAR|nr:hypothetical protein CPB83DRAFT_895958 [Crepidotus variabilis]